jgi:hypothetical protein
MFQNSWLAEAIFQLAKKPERLNVPANYKSTFYFGFTVDLEKVEFRKRLRLSALQ